MDLITCSRCGAHHERPTKFTLSSFLTCPYVCEDCRCIDCSIVLNIECECGESHATVSKENPRICAECETIRKRVAKLDPELLELRNSDISKQDPVYGIYILGAEYREIQ